MGMRHSLFCFVTAQALSAAAAAAGDAGIMAGERGEPLFFSVYVVAGQVPEVLASPQAAVDALRRLEIRKVYLEFCRAGTVIDRGTLDRARDLLLERGFAVAGGIATVPGAGFGTASDGQLNWFQYEDEKTRADLERVMRDAAPVFSEIIVDDFLCTDDTSVPSQQARGSRSWSDYRRDLMLDVAERTLIAPARAENPGITLVIKYPQWYDRYHLHGYDVARMTEQFDRVRVGTETRGADTQRFGFVQPYEGFVSFRWMRDVAGAKLGGAWFDHLDCDADAFLDQAYQTVLAGAHEIILFNFADIIEGHPGHELLRRDAARLAALAAAVDPDADRGARCYKPPHSDAGGDMYLMDYLGMLGIPLLPVSQFPEEPGVLVLPTQAAADPAVTATVTERLSGLDALFMTAGFLAAPAGEPGLSALAGVEKPVAQAPLLAESAVVDGIETRLPCPLELAADLSLRDAATVLEAVVAGRRVPFLTKVTRWGTPVYVLNVHTFTQADFDAVGEVLLAPKPAGLLELPQAWADILRDAFIADLGIALSAPPRVALQSVGENAWFLQNYREEPVDAVLSFDALPWCRVRDGFGGRGREAFPGATVTIDGARAEMRLEPRARVWFAIDEPLIVDPVYEEPPAQPEENQ
ncbi:MAG: hypothetical protein KA184_09140 [Candidatus Hydrogenedentes bacterium]|nr:hypothetical protein [Candidatus Hydrogenedentota bacterium]